MPRSTTLTKQQLAAILHKAVTAIASKIDDINDVDQLSTVLKSQLTKQEYEVLMRASLVDIAGCVTIDMLFHFIRLAPKE
jgi:hypothetical protein